MTRQKTKIVATIGPASDSLEIMEALLNAGMSIARINFSHGAFDSHAKVIKRLREAEQNTGKLLSIMADLPGPKIRIGELFSEPLELKSGDLVTLTTEEIIGNEERFTVNLESLPGIVRTGDRIFINDGIIALEVLEIIDKDISCLVHSGGELYSRKGVDLPGIDLGMCAFTERDRECLEFAMKHGIDAVSQSFVSRASDIEAVFAAAETFDKRPFVIAKIERAKALDNIREIIEVADGIMVARGDLGVEIPIAEMTIAQKCLMKTANAACKPVITATQMLESMTGHRRPTRAEATDVANAILDGTDAVMLSAESAIGRYPVEAVSMLADIAAATEPHQSPVMIERRKTTQSVSLLGLIAHNVYESANQLNPEAVLVPTRSGNAARNVARFRLHQWITSFSTELQTCRGLQFSYGVEPVLVEEDQTDWTPFVREWCHKKQQKSGLVILTQGPSIQSPDQNHSIQIVDLARHKSN